MNLTEFLTAEIDKDEGDPMTTHRPFTPTPWPVISLAFWFGAMLGVPAVTVFTAVAVGVSWPQLVQVAWLAVLPR